MLIFRSAAREAAGSILHAFIQPAYREHARVPLITGDHALYSPGTEINWHFNLAIRMCHRPLIYLSLSADLPRAARLIYFRLKRESLSINCSGSGPSPARL